ncbi:MAG: YceI family protein [Bacteroidia bacterium]|nr:YceI family protein [Bacteroidia bacterium]
MRYLAFVALIGVVCLSACTKAPKSQKAEAGQAEKEQNKSGAIFNLDAAKTSVKWIGTKVTGRHEGTIKIREGKLIVQGNEVIGGECIIDMSTIECLDLQPGKGKEKLEKHLKSADFFDVEKYPTAKLVITEVKKEPNGQYSHRVKANLTLKDITKSIEFGANIQVTESTVSAVSNFNIDRTEWGITYEGQKDNLIRKEVNFDINLTASKAAS